MLLTKVKIAAAVLGMLGLVVVTCEALAQQQRDDKNKAKPQAKAGSEPNADQVAPPSNTIKELREKRLALLVKIHAETMKRLTIDPNMPIGQVQQTLADVTAARLDLATTREDRIKVREQGVKEAKEWEKHVLKLYQEKLLSNFEPLRAQAYVLETRIALEKAKASAKSD